MMICVLKFDLVKQIVIKVVNLLVYLFFMNTFDLNQCELALSRQVQDKFFNTSKLKEFFTDLQIFAQTAFPYCFLTVRIRDLSDFFFFFSFTMYLFSYTFKCTFKNLSMWNAFVLTVCSLFWKEIGCLNQAILT